MNNTNNETRNYSTSKKGMNEFEKIETINKRSKLENGLNNLYNQLDETNDNTLTNFCTKVFIYTPHSVKK